MRAKWPTIQVGNYTIEHPTEINGHPARRTAFVIPNERARFQNSQFVTLYGDGRIGCDNPYQLPEGVKRALRVLSAKLADDS